MSAVSAQVAPGRKPLRHLTQDAKAKTRAHDELDGPRPGERVDAPVRGAQSPAVGTPEDGAAGSSVSHRAVRRRPCEDESVL